MIDAKTSLTPIMPTSSGTRDSLSWECSPTIQVSELFSGTHNLPKTGPIFRIRTDLDSVYQGKESIKAGFLIAALQGGPSPPQPPTMLRSPPLNLRLTYGRL